MKIISLEDSEASTSTIFSIKENITDAVCSPYSAVTTYSPNTGDAEFIDMTELNSPSTVNKLPLSICLPVGSIRVNFILSYRIISLVVPVNKIGCLRKYSF